MVTKKKKKKAKTTKKKKVQKRSDCTVIPVSPREPIESTTGIVDVPTETVVPTVILGPHVPLRPPHVVGTYLPDEPLQPLATGSKAKLYAFFVALLSLAFFIPGMLYGDLLIQCCSVVILGVSIIMVIRSFRYKGRAVVPFTETAVRRYLDRCIRSWRREENLAQNLEMALIAKSHIEAYQNVRETVFGRTLP